MVTPVQVLFSGGSAGAWKINRIDRVVGDVLPWANRLEVTEGAGSPTSSASAWRFRGITSNGRYTNRSELDLLSTVQQPLARFDSTCAALIPIRKSDAWWNLAQDERRAIFEQTSHHIEIGLQYLPAVARRLYHCRDIGEPFDFLTWFEYSPASADAFETMVRRLRQTPEWSFVEREVDIRLSLSS